jgi:protein-S-isoprenylcysteine O-methyltransferase Ste14
VKGFLESAGKLIVLGIFAIFAARLATAFADTGRWVYLLLLAGELVTMAVYASAKPATVVDWSLLSIVTTNSATFYWLLFDLTPGVSYAPELGLALQVVGIALQLWAKLTLGRSFGLLPAARSMVESGPYQWIRHPIYAGYLISHIGVMLGTFSFWNLLLYVGLNALQFFRIAREERVLKGALDYGSYQQRVRYKIIPGLL